MLDAGFLPKANLRIFDLAGWREAGEVKDASQLGPPQSLSGDFMRDYKVLGA
jgi:hypothetical protein